MSNLSELLPTGGGQNAVDFVATGTLASGQAVALKTDGTVEVISQTAAGAGTPSLFNSGYTNYPSATYDSANEKIVIAYNDEANSYYGTAIVGTVSGTSISFGTAVVFESANLISISATYDSTNNKIVVAYADKGNSNYGTAVVGTVSGTAISFGSATVFESAYSTYIAATYDSTAQRVVIAYQDNPNSIRGTAIVGTVSGTSISFGTAVVFETGNTSEISITFDSSAQKIVIAYQDSSNSLYGTAIVGSVSGTSITFGTAVVFESATTAVTSIAYDSTSNKVVIAYRDESGSNYGTAIVGTVSGTSISFGTAVVFASVYTSFISAVSSGGTVVICYQDNPAGNYGKAIIGTVSGTSISFGTAVVFESANTRDITSTYDANSQRVVIAYRDVDNSNYGTSVVFSPASSNNTSFIGITAEAISNAATGPVNVYGGINTAQTGLTIASDYYVQEGGTLSTASASPAIKVGQAVSATTINMKDLT